MEFTRGEIAGTAPRAQPSLIERVNELYVAHREEIFRFLAAQGVAVETAQDITQEVFVKLLVSLRGGSKITSELPWLYRVAANQAVDYWRRERRVITVELDAEDGPWKTLESSEVRADDEAAEKQRMRRLRFEISRLPKEHRMCVLLRSQGLRYREISRILGVGVSTAAEWLDAAVERLRRVIHE